MFGLLQKSANLGEQMIKQVQEYVESLYILESLVGNKMDKYKVVRDSDKLHFSSLTVVYEKSKKSTTKYVPSFTFITESDFSVSFFAKFNKWDGPLDKELNKYAKEHQGYKEVKVKDYQNHFYFNFKDFDSFKIFYDNFWKIYLG